MLCQCYNNGSIINGDTTATNKLHSEKVRLRSGTLTYLLDSSETD